MSTKIYPIDVVEYPDSDGKPMAENTLQYEWIVTLKGNIDSLFANDPNVFVAGDNFIYTKKGEPSEVKAPDVYVAFGRPKHHRGSYKLWEEDHIFPQVIFEVLSPGNSGREMELKRQFYERHGAEEFYILDPDFNTLDVWLLENNRLVEQKYDGAFVSPRLGIRFEQTRDDLIVTKPDGRRFLSFQETSDLAARADREQARADQEQARADQEQARAEAEIAKSARLAAKLRALGIDPDAV